MKKIIITFVSIIMMAVTLTGCGDSDNSIQTYVISNESYTSQDELESATGVDTLSPNESIYASFHFVESPKGMEYTVIWYIDGTEIKTETKATENERQDIIVYELEAEQVEKGSLKVEVFYKETLLLTEELLIQ